MATSKTLKTLLFFTIIVAILSLIAMFVYTGKVSQKWKESLSEVLHAQNLSWIDTSELDLSDDGAFNDTLAETFGHIHQLQKGLSILNNPRPARKYGKLCPEKGSSQGKHKSTDVHVGSVTKVCAHKGTGPPDLLQDLFLCS